ncbi:hypothetical protein MN608_03958 [Microdochium nivale]|nr:hypothetical protein MN608_03958 [Microdochium nivale]
MLRLARSPTALVLVSLISSVIAGPARAECLVARSDQLAALSSCGDTALLSTCLSSVPELATLDAVKSCFLGAGCSADDAAIEAGFVLKQCEQGLDGAELRLRGAMESMPLITDTPNALNARQAGHIGFVPPLQCSTDTTYTVDACTSSVVGTVTSTSCGPTALVTQVCDRANVCMKDTKGLDVCMMRRDMPTTDGLIVTIFLLVVFVIGVGTMIFLCCKDAREVKRIRAQHEAAQMVKDQKMAAASSGPAPKLRARPSHPRPGPLWR